MGIGKGGVSDYSILFAQELRTQGKSVVLVSTNAQDVSTSDEIFLEGIPHLRLPRNLKKSEKREKINQFLSHYEVEVAYLQVVPVAYYPRGWMGNASEFNGLHFVQWIVMFHEIWVGASKSAPWKHQFLGIFQRQGMRVFLNKIQPFKILTSNAVYLNLIQKLGVQCQRLPLFGNINIQEGEPQKKDLSVSNAFKGMIFGTLHSQCSLEKIFERLKTLSEREGRRLQIFSLGKIGVGIEKWRGLEKKYKESIECTLLGELEEEEISRWMQFVDFGIATTPWENIGKSGSVIAMLEHGLPVIVFRSEAYPVETKDPIHEDPQLFHFDRFLKQEFLQNFKKRKMQNGLSEVVKKFLDEF